MWGFRTNFFLLKMTRPLESFSLWLAWLLTNKKVYILSMRYYKRQNRRYTHECTQYIEHTKKNYHYMLTRIVFVTTKDNNFILKISRRSTKKDIPYFVHKYILTFNNVSNRMNFYLTEICQKKKKQHAAGRYRTWFCRGFIQYFRKPWLPNRMYFIIDTVDEKKYEIIMNCIPDYYSFLPNRTATLHHGQVVLNIFQNVTIVQFESLAMHSLWKKKEREAKKWF